VLRLLPAQVAGFFFRTAGVSEQLFIDFTAQARRSDPSTSRDAAARVDGKALAAQVHNELVRGGPGTSHELAERLNMSLVTVSPRMKPLEDAGKVKRCGKRDGRTVWAAA
jgi:DNA-binding MarR family transcriptional regulator